MSAAVQLMQINSNEYRKKVFGCFVGKSIGGTLGMKYEGDLNYNNVTYYDPVPDSMLPNDDLDLQVVNLETLIRTGFPVCRYNISEIWKYHLDDSAPDEYGAAISNHRNKIFSPLSGIYRNKFTEGLGGAIRSEIWACIAPGNPSLAAKLAKEDACTDHDENGIYAEMFLAAFESLAFVESDIRKITELALKEIPDGCKLKAALTDTIKWVGQADDLLSVRANILEYYPSDNWTDVCINLPFMLLALYSADGDFDKAICTAASLGYDGDCTTATVGAIMGIIAPDSMTEKWTAPIGKDLVLTTCILNMHEAASIDDFCKKIVSIAYDAQTFYRTDVQFSDELPISERTVLPKPWSENFNEVFNWEIGEKTSLIAIRPFLISLTYPETVSAVPGQECKLTLKLCNTSKVPMKGKVGFRLLDGWKITCPQPEFDLAVGESTEIPFRLFISVPRRRVNLNLLSIDLEANGVITTLEAGIPLTKRWKVTDLTDKKEFFTETPGNYFTVPAGKYVYRTFVTAASNRSVKISANGTGSFRLFLNGKEIIVSNGDCYVASFHREGNWDVVELSMNKNEILVEFDNDTETEFFMEFGTLYACGTWLDSIEFTTEGM